MQGAAVSCSRAVAPSIVAFAVWGQLVTVPTHVAGEYIHGDGPKLQAAYTQVAAYLLRVSRSGLRFEARIGNVMLEETAAPRRAIAPCDHRREESSAHRGKWQSEKPQKSGVWRLSSR